MEPHGDDEGEGVRHKDINGCCNGEGEDEGSVAGPSVVMNGFLDDGHDGRRWTPR